jgi:plasmid maintenance system antidote protein VapI
MRIYTTRRLVAALMEKYDIESKYALAKLMGASQKAVRNWIDEGRTMDETHAAKAAELLGLDYEFVLICIQMERSKKNPDVARAWHRIADSWDASHVATFTLAFVGTYLVLPLPSGVIC